MKTEIKTGIIQLETKSISYNLHPADRKNMRIIIEPNMQINVYVPLTAGTEEINTALHKKHNWIVKTINKIETYHPLPEPKKYISGETFIYLGRQYRLRIHCKPENSTKLIGRFLNIYTPDTANRENVKKQVDVWYKEHAEIIFRKYLQKCYCIASRHNIPEPALSIRTMKRRWGSCSSAGKITLNIKLVQVPAHCIEYVIMHELCHIKYHNHSKEFYRLLTKCQPDWKTRKYIIDQFKLC